MLSDDSTLAVSPIHSLTANTAQNQMTLHKVTNAICTNKIKLLLDLQSYHWAGEDTPLSMLLHLSRQ